MKKGVNKQKNNNTKINLISIRKHLYNIKSKDIPKFKNKFQINLQKSPLIAYKEKKENLANINSYFKGLKKNNSQLNDMKYSLPILNSNNNQNSINSSNEHKISFYSISNNRSSVVKENSIDIPGHKSVKTFKRKPIKIQFFSKAKSISVHRGSNSSNILKGLVSPRFRNLRKGNNLLHNTPNSENKETTNENKNINLSNINNDQEKNHLKGRINKFKPFGFSEFYNISKHSDVSAKSIYKHYILEEMKDETPEISNNFTKYILKKYKNPKSKLNELYGINENNIRRINELKNNKTIALKDDFNLKEYQNILCGMIKKRCTNDTIIYLKKQYEKFNDEMNSYKRNFINKGRYTKLADKIRKNAPSYLINRLKQLDEENLISKAKYFHVDLSKNQDKNE